MTEKIIDWIIQIYLVIKKDRNRMSSVMVWLDEYHKIDNKSLFVISNESEKMLFNVYFFARSNHQIVFNKKGKSFSEVFPGYREELGFYEYIPPRSIRKKRMFNPRSAGQEHLVPELCFTDYKGRKWYVQANGNLHRIDDYMKMLQNDGHAIKHFNK
ncbi:hypothetical protein AKUH1B104J_01130 [Apilactobacillus kunkeei]|nr:hypothetical protein AKUH1B104J_01130 [Apilactobacillus kunkeei]